MSSRSVHGEVSSSDASAGVAFTLFAAAGTEEESVGASERLEITSLSIVVGSALTVDVFTGSDMTASAGERIAKGNFAASGGMVVPLPTSRICPAGTVPRLKTSGSGQVDAILHGVIR